LDLDADFGRVDVVKAHGLPIEILAIVNDAEHGVVAPLGLALERRNADVENWKHEVVAPELSFPLQERLELELAMAAPDRRWRDDRDEEHRLRHRRLQLLLPQTAVRDRGGVLPEPEVGAGPAELAAQLALDAVPQGRQCPAGIIIVGA